MKNLNYIIAALVAMLFLRCTPSPEIEVFGSIKGVVMDEFVQKPVSGASVSLSPLGKTIVTKSDGAFEFVELDAQQYKVSVSKEGYSSDSKTITVHPGVEAEANFAISTAKGAVLLSKEKLDFGLENTTLAFDITNIGISTLFFNIACDSYDWLKVSPVSGQIEGSTKQPITITIDRDKIEEDKKITLPITSNMGSGEVEIIVDFDENAPIMEVSKTELDFGEAETELFFEITNSGKSTLTYEIKEEKAWLTTTANSFNIEAGKTMVVTAKINRELITKNEQTTILIASNGGSAEIDVNVIYLEKKAVLTVSETSLDFGTEETTLYFQVKNKGNSDLLFEISENKPWLTITTNNNTVAAGDYEVVTATVDRDQLKQSETFDLLVTSNGGDATIEINVEYYVATAEMEVSVNALDFGETENALFFQVKNTGDADLLFEISENKPWLTITTNNNTVAAGDYEVVTATVDRDQLKQSETFDLLVTSNGGDATIEISIDYAVYNAVMEVSTETLDFGDTKSTLIFQIENSGNIDLTFECTENEDWFTLSASSYTVTPNNVAHLTATIDRTLVTQKKEFELLITSNGGYKTINVSAQPYIPTAVLAVTPEELDFGDAETTMFFKVRNDGDAQLTFAITEELDWLTLTASSYEVTPSNEVMVTATIDRSLITESQERIVYITSNGGTEEVAIKVVIPITFDDAIVTSLDDDMPVTITGAKMVGDDYEIYLDIKNNNRRWSYLMFGTSGINEIATYATDNLNNTYWLPEYTDGDRQVTLKINNEFNDYSYRYTNDFILNATFPVVVTIKDINADATNLKKLQIGCYCGTGTGTDSDRRCILIENLPIIR